MLRALSLCLLAAVALAGADPAAPPPAAVPAGQAETAKSGLPGAESARLDAAKPDAAKPDAAKATSKPEAPVFSDAEWNRSQTQGPGQASPASVTGRAAVGLLVSVGAIVALAVVLGLVVKRLGVKRMLPGKGRHLEVIETVPIGFKRAVSLLRLGDQILVVGQGEHELQHLATLPASVLGDAAKPASPAAAPAPTGDAPPAPGQLTAFRATLEQVIGKRP
jgi:flagellar biogenesis protein FliO